MATIVAMPKFGLSMEEGTISCWNVHQGDKVKKDDSLAEINSEKLTNDAKAPCDGVLAKIILQEGECCPCGEPICIIASANEDISSLTGEKKADNDNDASHLQPAPHPLPIPEAESDKAPVGKAKITPRALKVAIDNNLDYSHIVGTGIGGMITIDDLKRFATPNAAKEAPKAPVAAAQVVVAPAAAVTLPTAAPTPCPGNMPQPVYAQDQGGAVKMTSMQAAICRSMYQSMMTSAQTTLATEADVTNLVAVYGKNKAKYAAAGVKLSYTAMIVKAFAAALENHPAMRVMMADETHFTTMEHISIGVAVDVPNGLIVPVIRDANLKDLRTICIELKDLTDRAKDGKLTSDDMGNATMTLTNLGMFDVTYFTPVLNLPESIIVGTGAIIKKTIVKGDSICIGSVMNMSLTHDHRTVNGAPAARFLQEVVHNLQNFGWL